MNSLELENDFGFISVELKAANTYSRNNLPESPLFEFQQDRGVGTGLPKINTIPESLVTTVIYNGSGETRFFRVNLFSTDYKENGLLFKGDFKVPYGITDFASGFIKFGGLYQRKKHENDQNTPYADINTGSDISQLMFNGILQQFPYLTVNTARNRITGTGLTTDNQKLYNSFLGDKFGKVFWACNPDLLMQITNYIRSVPEYNATYGSTAVNPGGWFEGIYQQVTNDYLYTEKYYAGYLMAQLNFLQNLLIVGGVRFEEIKSEYIAYNLRDARDPSSQTYSRIIAHPYNRNVLPMVQFKFSPFSWNDIRYSYSQTLARPDFHQLSPRIALNYDRTTVWKGNPNLKPAKSFNHDLVVTFFSNELGLFSVGGFYKEIKNFAYSYNYVLHPKAYQPNYDSLESFPIELRPKDNARLYTYINSRHTAYVSGIELDLQTRFWYLPFPMDGLLMGVNYSRVWSKTKIPWTEDRVFGRPPRQTIVAIDSTRSVRLLYQPNDIANAFIGYDYKGFSAKVSFVFQGNSINTYSMYDESEGYTKDYYRVDASVRQMLPWGLQLFLDVNNINNVMNEAAQRSINGFTRQQNYGLVVNLGVRYLLSQ